jgi:sialic acid synthase SpsE
MATFRIGNRLVGKDQPCFIIAEAGVNHNGDLATAKKLIDAAADAKVDAVKFQILTAKGLYVKNAGTFTREWGEMHDIYEVWKKTEVPDFWIPELVAHCKQRGVIFFSSVFDEATVDLLDPFVDVYKIASSETSHIPLLQKVARTGKPVLFSIGGATMDEVQEAFAVLRAEGNEQIAILQCVQKYPTPLVNANVTALRTLQYTFPRAVLGYSDHSIKPGEIPGAAVLFGASIIEKHYTLSRGMEGIDHKMSLEPSELKEMVTSIRETERKMQSHQTLSINPAVLGHGHVQLEDDCKDMMTFLRRTLFAMRDIAPGEAFTSENVAVLRPGNRDVKGGLHPREYNLVLRKHASCSINKHDLITRIHFD